MRLAGYVLGREVAILETVGDFKSVLTYHADTTANDLVSLTMRVRAESYVWEDQLHPIFQMNLPEGSLLQVLQEQFGPHVSGSPTALLSVIGRNMVGRLQIAAPGATLNEPANPIEVADILQGDNSEAAFAELVRQHAASGVSGVVPKFLDAQQDQTTRAPLNANSKRSLLTRQHIIKGSSNKLPYAALNEHFCMQVAAKVLPTAKAKVSQDGKALVVHRFDVDEYGQPYWGLEDFCALLGLRPASKYDATWERIAKAVRDHVPGAHRLNTYRHLAATLLLTYALRNANCHAKNLSLLYTSRSDVHISPTYDMLTTCVYADYQHNPPAIAFMGKKTWAPGKNLQKFIAATFGVSLKEQTTIVEAICNAVSSTAPFIREAMNEHPEFEETGKRMLLAWGEGVAGLRDKRVYAVGDWALGKAFDGFSEPSKLETSRSTVGASELLAPKR
jgi:serine/threonine-protein kinase HipA